MQWNISGANWGNFETRERSRRSTIHGIRFDCREIQSTTTGRRKGEIKDPCTSRASRKGTRYQNHPPTWNYSKKINISRRTRNRSQKRGTESRKDLERSLHDSRRKERKKLRTECARTLKKEGGIEGKKVGKDTEVASPVLIPKKVGVKKGKVRNGARKT